MNKLHLEPQYSEPGFLEKPIVDLSRITATWLWKLCAKLHLLTNIASPYAQAAFCHRGKESTSELLFLQTPPAPCRG